MLTLQLMFGHQKTNKHFLASLEPICFQFSSDYYNAYIMQLHSHLISIAPLQNPGSHGRDSMKQSTTILIRRKCLQ